MTAYTAGVVVGVADRGSFLPSLQGDGLGVRLRANIAFSAPITGVLQAVTSCFALIFNKFSNRRYFVGVGVAAKNGAYRYFRAHTGSILYFFAQKANFYTFHFYCYTVTKIVRHSVSKGFGCNSTPKLLHFCYKLLQSVTSLLQTTVTNLNICVTTT